MAISLNTPTSFFLGQSQPDRNQFLFVFRNGIDQELCDLHFLVLSDLLPPPLITRITIQTSFTIKTEIVFPTSALDIEFHAFLGRCIPFSNSFPGEIFWVTLTFSRPFVDSERLIVSPTDLRSNIVFA